MLQLRYRRLWLGSVWTLVLIVVIASLLPASIVGMEHGLDKLGHFSGYLLLAVFGAGIVAVDKVPVVMLRVFLLGLGLEGAQALFTETRNAEWGDAGADAAGVLAAWWLCRLGLAEWARLAETWLDRWRQR